MTHNFKLKLLSFSEISKVYVFFFFKIYEKKKTIDSAATSLQLWKMLHYRFLCRENYEQSDDKKLLNHTVKTANGPRFNPIQDGLFRDCSFLGTFAPYLKKVKRPHKSSYTFPKCCWHQYFFTGNQKFF